MEKMTYREFKEKMTQYNMNGKTVTGVIVFTEDSFNKLYSLDSRSYRVSSNAKVFTPTAKGYSLFGTALDGSDTGVNLVNYIDVEYGRECCESGGWHVDYCYIED